MKTQVDSASETVKYLCSIPLFSDLDVISLIALARASRFQRVEKGQILFFQSDPSELAYIVRSGNISIILNSPDGREMVINEMHSGDLFGELGILTKKSRSTSAIARTKSELLVIPRQAFLNVIENEPKLALRILEITASRLQMSSEREGALVFMDEFG